MITPKSRSDYNNWHINLDMFCMQDKEGNEIFMQPRLLKLLFVLTNRSNRVISRQELIAKVWDDVVVGEESLSKAAFDLRQFLDENFINRPNIETIRKVGYRLKPSSQSLKNGLRVKVFRVIKTIAYSAVIGIIIVLVLRGLRY
jgi:DNA-binding winged helix-turn-helix (wHTH) protein